MAMPLFPEERKRLDRIDGTLRAEAPALASKFDMFTRLARGEARPPAERQFRADGPWRYDSRVRRRVRRYVQVALALLLTALTLLVVLELA